MIEFQIDEERCIQCGECVEDCPAAVLAMDGYPKMINEEGCYRCQHCLAVCPTAAVSILGRNPDASTSLAGNLPEPAKLATLVKGRRAVRRYKDEDLEPALLDELLSLAWHAPTGVNNQGVRFTVLRDRKAVAALRDEMLVRLEQLKQDGKLPDGIAGRYLGWTLKAWKEQGKDVIFRGAPHLVITSAPKAAPCPVQDTHIALATFDLVAQASGVGTVWDGIFMMALSLFPDIAGKLGIPEDHVIGYAMAFGKPAVEYHRTVQRGPADVHLVDWQ